MTGPNDVDNSKTVAGPSLLQPVRTLAIMSTTVVVWSLLTRIPDCLISISNGIGSRPFGTNSTTVKCLLRPAEHDSTA